MRDTPSILPLNVDNLVFARDGRRLIDDVSFALPRGGLTALIGPNGAGKSLLLRLCHGLIVPSQGRVVWADGAGGAGGRRAHAMVFQHPVMLRRSVRANMLHALRASGRRSSECAQLCNAALERFGMSVMADRPARVLSGGEQQRLAIARAWALLPEVIFLDEPTANLDPGATRQIEAVLTDLVADGVTLVLATHDFAQARRLARHVMFVHQGKLLESSPAAAFFAQPATDQARAFLAGELVW